MFDLIVSETGESGVTTLDLPGAEMPFSVHVFGAESVARWNDAADEERAETAAAIVLRLFILGSTYGLTDDDVARVYNETCASAGIADHAVEFTG